MPRPVWRLRDEVGGRVTRADTKHGEPLCLPRHVVMVWAALSRGGDGMRLTRRAVVLGAELASYSAVLTLKYAGCQTALLGLGLSGDRRRPNRHPRRSVGPGHRGVAVDARRRRV
ncbi:MAG: hypothetical protein QOF67_1616, partial [Mycobacterium sp.]|nr:hypothetical protein [Mycobacterium sp.]